MPKTKCVTFKNIKLGKKSEEFVQGSFQTFIPNAVELRVLQKEEFNLLPKQDIQKIAIQDIRFLNADRHLGNLLKDSDGNVYPIDHGLILPNVAKRLVYYWSILPQTREPLEAEDKKYIRNINIEEDAKLLRKLGIEKSAIERMKLSTRLLQKAAMKDLPLWHISRLMITGTDPKIPLKSKTNDSYFESKICTRVFQNKEDIETVLDELIVAYIANHLQHTKNPPPYKRFGWTKKKPLDNGLNYYKFWGCWNGRQQKIHVIDFQQNQSNQLGIRILDHRDSDLNDKQYGPGAKITDVSKRDTNIMAMINGGFYHYSKKSYPWKNRKYNIGDPIGLLKINGQTKTINHTEYSKNPDKNLWGVFAVDTAGKAAIFETGASQAGIDPSRWHEAIGSGPVLIQNGQLTDLDKKVQKLVKRTFKKKNYAPGDFIKHYNQPNPRSCIGIKSDGTLLLVTVDGRREDAKGMTCKELAEFMKNLGCVDAINLDGGGSASLLAKKKSSDAAEFVSKPSNSKHPITSSIAITRVSSKLA